MHSSYTAKNMLNIGNRFSVIRNNTHPLRMTASELIALHTICENALDRLS